MAEDAEEFTTGQPEESEALGLATPTGEDSVSALKSEVSRLREEKRLAGEIFSETIYDYEEEIKALKKQLAVARQQLQSRTSASWNSRAAPLRLFSRSSQQLLKEGAPSEAQDSGLEADPSFRSEKPANADSSSGAEGGGPGGGFEGAVSQSSSLKTKTKRHSPSLQLQTAPPSSAEEERQTSAGVGPGSNGDSSGLRRVAATLPSSACEAESGGNFKRNPLQPRTAAVSRMRSWKTMLFSKERSPFPALKTLQGPGLGGGRASSLWIAVLADWQTQIKSPRFKALLRMGVPHDVRGEVWKRAVADTLNLTPHFYDLLVRRVQNARRHLLKTSSKYRERVEAIGGLGSWGEESSEAGHLDAAGSSAASSSNTARSDNSASSDCAALNASLESAKRHEPSLNSQSVQQSRGGALRADGDEAGGGVVGGVVSCCSCGCFQWEQEVFASFLTLSADLHRTLPRLGISPGGGSSSQKAKRQGQRSAAAAETDGGEGSGSLQTTAAESREAAAVEEDDSCTPPSQTVQPVPFGVASAERMEVFLRNVLEVYVMLRPDQGYVQGMAFIAATLLLYMGEYSAFVCFANLMMRPSLRAFYAFDMTEVAVYFRTFDCLLEEKLPQVFQHWSALGIETDFFLVEWMYTLFTRCLPFELLTRVWDLLLIEGDVVLFQTSLAMVSYFQSELQQQSLDECMALLSPSTTTHFKAMETERFLSLLHNLRLTPQRLEAVMSSVRETLEERKRRERMGFSSSLRSATQEGPALSATSSDATPFILRQQTAHASAFRSRVSEGETLLPLRMAASADFSSSRLPAASGEETALEPRDSSPVADCSPTFGVCEGDTCAAPEAAAAVREEREAAAKRNEDSENPSRGGGLLNEGPEERSET